MYYFVNSLISDVFRNPVFRIEQNEVAKRAYEVLSASYERKENEVTMITNLCNNMHGVRCGRANLYAKKVHGLASQVEFYNGARKTQKEFADMVVISRATYKKRIIFEKVAFIQNKKERPSKKWSIDSDQLYLLHNLPTFNGISGIFNKQKDIALQNAHGRLGNYGLFQADGEMAFVNANVVNAIRDNNIVSLEKVRNETAKHTEDHFASSLLFSFFDPRLVEELLYRFHKHHFLFPSFVGLPILGNCSIALNLYQFIRNWTQFNIGETTVIDGCSVNDILANLSDCFIRGAKIEEFFDYNRIETNETREWLPEFGEAVFVLHYDVETE